MKRRRLAIVTTHPIQYYDPVFRALARSQIVQPRVFYTWSQSEAGLLHDLEFGRGIRWDIPLLNGYEYEFVPNISRRPGTNHFRGIINPDLNTKILAWGADAILAFGWKLQSHLGALRFFHGRIPVFFRGDSTLLNRAGTLQSALRKLILTWVYSHVDMAIAVGTSNREYFSWCGLSPAQISLAPHCIDNNRFADVDGVQEQRALAIRQKLGIRTGEIVLLYAGKFIEQKALEPLIAGFGQAAVDAHLVLVGDGPLEPRLRIAASGNRRIHFLPFQNQSAMPSVYRTADVFVLPSCSETWGLALNEAMASSRPVLASSNVGAVRDLVKPGANGWVFRSGSVADLAAKIRGIVAGGAAALRVMGTTARGIIDESTPEISATKIAEIVSSI